MTTKLSFPTFILSGFAVLFAGISPNLLVIAQAGYAQLSSMAVWILIPSILFLGLVFLIARNQGEWILAKTMAVGAFAGIAGTVGLEIVRETGFLLGGMPGEMPKLMGVMILNRFALGPNWASNLAGYAYHFWNGASFGIVLAVLFGHVKWGYGILFALFIALGFMAGPATVALGVGRFGVDFGWGFPITVTLAHVVYGAIFGIFAKRWLPDGSGLLRQLLFSRRGSSLTTGSSL